MLKHSAFYAKSVLYTYQLIYCNIIRLFFSFVCLTGGKGIMLTVCTAECAVGIQDKAADDLLSVIDDNLRIGKFIRPSIFITQTAAAIVFETGRQRIKEQLYKVS